MTFLRINLEAEFIAKALLSSTVPVLDELSAVGEPTDKVNMNRGPLAYRDDRRWVSTREGQRGKVPRRSYKTRIGDARGVRDSRGSRTQRVSSELLLGESKKAS